MRRSADAATRRDAGARAASQVRWAPEPLPKLLTFSRLSNLRFTPVDENSVRWAIAREDSHGWTWRMFAWPSSCLCDSTSRCARWLVDARECRIEICWSQPKHLKPQVVVLPCLADPVHADPAYGRLGPLVGRAHHCEDLAGPPAERPPRQRPSCLGRVSPAPCRTPTARAPVLPRSRIPGPMLPDATANPSPGPRHRAAAAGGRWAIELQEAFITSMATMRGLTCLARSASSSSMMLP
jgi:hypothetical protein